MAKLKSRKTSSIMFILTIILMLSIGSVSAAHTASYSQIPEWAQGNANTIYTWTITNDGPDAIDKVYITIPTEFAAVDCSAGIPTNWGLQGSGTPSGVTCAYQSQNPSADIPVGDSLDFEVEVTTAGTTGEDFEWRLYTGDVNGATSPTTSTLTKVDADAPTITVDEATDGTNTITDYLGGDDYLTANSVDVIATVEDADSGVDTVTLYYTIGANPEDSIAMSLDSGNIYSGVYTGTIPAGADTEEVYFRIVAEDEVTNSYDTFTDNDYYYTVDGVVDAVNANGDYNIDEGDGVTLDSTGTTDLNGIVSYTWEVSAHIVSHDANPTITWQELVDATADNDGIYTVSLYAWDGLGNSRFVTTHLNIANVAPSVEVTSPNGGEEWAGLHNITWTASDPSPVDEAALTFDIYYTNDAWTTSQLITSGVTNYYYTWNTKMAADDDDFEVKVVAHDDDTSSEDISDGVFLIDNTAPTIDMTGSDTTIDEGENLLLDASSSSDNAPPGIGLDWVAYDINDDGEWDYNETVGTMNIPYSSLVTKEVGDDGTYTIQIEMSDLLGNIATETHDFTVNNVNPTTTAGADIAGDEGSIVTATASCTDPGVMDTWDATFNWGDGTADTIVPGVTCDGTVFSADHTYADGGVPPTDYTVTITVEDDDTGTGADTLIATISNVNPTVTMVEQATPGPYINSILINWTVTDPAGSVDEMYNIDVEIYNSLDFLVSTPYSGARTYANINDPVVADISTFSTGDYYVKVTVTDKDTGQGSDATGLFEIVEITDATPIETNAYTLGYFENQPAGQMCQNRILWIGADVFNTIPYLGDIQFRFVAPDGSDTTEWMSMDWDINVYYDYYGLGWLWKAGYYYEEWWLEEWWISWYYEEGWSTFNIEYRILLEGWYWDVGTEQWIWGYFNEIPEENPAVYPVELLENNDVCTYTAGEIDLMIADLQTQIDANDADIADLQGRMDVAEADIDALELDIIDLQAQITANDADIAALNLAIADLQNQIDDNEALIAANTAEIDALKVRMSEAESDIDVLLVSVGDLQVDVSDLQTRMADAETAIGNLEIRIADAEVDILALDTELGNLIADLDILGFSITDTTVDDWTTLTGTVSVTTSMNAVCTWTNEQDGTMGSPSTLGTTHTFEEVTAQEGINVFSAECTVTSANNGIDYVKDKIVVFNVNTDNSYDLITNLFGGGSLGWRFFFLPYYILQDVELSDYLVPTVMDNDDNVEGNYMSIVYYDESAGEWKVYDAEYPGLSTFTDYSTVTGDVRFWVQFADPSAAPDKLRLLGAQPE